MDQEDKGMGCGARSHDWELDELKSHDTMTGGEATIETRKD
jgi:hypothetical protein